jgi:hypothetical protein
VTTLYLAMPGPQRTRAIFGDYDWSRPPAMLSSYAVNDHLNPSEMGIVLHPRRTLRDSGAYSAWNSGKVIDFDAYVEHTKSGGYDEYVALDVIGDAKASYEQAYRMREAGSPAFPVFHIGDPWSMLDDYCRDFDKVGLSCLFGEAHRESVRFIEQAFHRAWPHKFHSFGWTGEKLLRRFPFHSADSTSWCYRPCALNVWNMPSGIVRLRKDVSHRRSGCRWCKASFTAGSTSRRRSRTDGSER